jgi:hypothetical protein
VQRTAVDGISQMSRATQGVIVQRLREGDRISAVAMVDASVEIDEGPAGDPLPLDGAAPIAAVAPAPAVAEDDVEDEDVGDESASESILDLADEAIDGGEDDDAVADDEEDEV